MIVKNQNDILTILKMYMDNMDIRQSQISKNTGIARSHVSRTFSNKHAVNIDTLLQYIDACNAVLDINILPNPNKGKNTDSNNKDK